MFSWFNRETAEESKEKKEEKKALNPKPTKSYNNETNSTQPTITTSTAGFLGQAKNAVCGTGYTTISGNDTPKKNDGHNPRRSRSGAKFGC